MGGSSGGGGGNSGKVDYPMYIKKIHAYWLNHDNEQGTGDNKDAIESSITDTMNSALGASPFIGLTAFDPGTNLNTVDNRLDDFLAWSLNTTQDARQDQIAAPLIGLFDPDTVIKAGITDFKDKVMTELYSSTEINADISAFSAKLNAINDSDVLPRFRRGMQDINAVQSSTFVIGEALIMDAIVREVAKYGSALRLQNYAERNKIVTQLSLDSARLHLQALTSDREYALKQAMAEYEYQKAVVSLSLEFHRIWIVAKKEELEQTIEIEEKDAKWDLEVYQYGANLLAAAAGGTVSHPPKNNKSGSSIGGALAGVAMGAQMGSMFGPWGTGIGAIVGGIGGFFM